MEGNNIEIIIGANTSFNHTNHFCAQEDNVKIIVGKNCMFANHIIVRTSDSHPIFDMVTGERINKAKDVVIEDNVWVAASTTIMKGVHIGMGSIVGYGSIVTKNVPQNTLVAGIPAKEIKNNVCWRHHFDERIR